MSQFFNRYVPPSPKPTDEQKHKSENTTGTNHRKRKRAAHSDAPKDDVEGASRNVKATENISGGSSGRNVLDKYSVSRAAKSLDESVSITHKKKQKTRKRSIPPKDQGDDGQSESGSQDSDTKSKEQHDGSKHQGVLRKYDKSRKQSQANGFRDVDVDTPDAQHGSHDQTLHDLVPIPQPPRVEAGPKALQYSTLPTWQAAPTTIGPPQTVGFDAFGLSDGMLSNLKGHDLHTAFAVQSAVIPLLMQGNKAHQGDLCISAATGSGKTLAYVIPIVEHLRKSKGSGLRAVIVVPTRELVKQVRGTCEMCTSGSSLNIMTALGSKSLQDEQKALIEEEDVYDPAAYQAELNAPIDWTTFSLERVLRRGSQKDSTKLKDHVTRTRIRADILITTPGRLVDHLQETDGFHLDDVKWLVVDEADRLLNESYQDWVDTVVPALQSTRATQKRDKILTHMRMKPPPRIVRKILLSATMTKDISKLNQIGLTNPKMIVFDPSNGKSFQGATADATMEAGQPVPDETGKYALPATLREVAVGFKDGTDKPLILLQLLEKHISVLDQDDTAESETTESSSSGSSDDSSSSSSEDSSTSDSEDSSSDASSSTSSSRPSSRNRKSDFIKPLHYSLDTRTSSATRCLVFTRSTAAALRLSRLLSIVSPKLKTRVAVLTRSTTSSSASRKALSSFRSGKTPILIATDRASRGIDIPGLENVISYDVPGSALTYIHRVGRTARAGKEGHAWTLVEHREGRWFWNEIGGKSQECTIGRATKLKKLTVAVDDGNEELKRRYENALAVLGSEVRGE